MVPVPPPAVPLGKSGVLQRQRPSVDVKVTLYEVPLASAGAKNGFECIKQRIRLNHTCSMRS